MYLSKLEIHGFKSFAQKTTLRFTDGLTAIVGPNGSGKTNIVDAIRWVLGEQKSSVLRSDGMEQVIFNGTRSRKPLGMSEVALTIENNKHVLPTEFSQVVIARRLFRDGESQYLLNRTPCRLRDIIDLFTDTGMGADAYSVIELKMIEQILSDRSDDRRHLFEEAAGVVKYKQRRKETLRRLAATQNDLARVQDIIREVQKSVNSLARQADKAKSYSQLAEKLKALEAELYRREYADTMDNIRSIGVDMDYARSERSKHEKELLAKEEQLAGLEQRDALIEQELTESQERERQTSTEASNAQQALAVIRERFSAVQRDSERARQEQNDSKRQVERLKEEIEHAQQSLEGALEQQELNDETLRVAREERIAAHENVSTLREQSRIAGEPVLAIDSRIQFLLAGRDRLRRQVDSLHTQSQALARQAEQNEQQQSALDQRVTAEEENLTKAQHHVSEAETQLQQARLREEELAKNIEEQQHTLSEFRSDLSHKRASLEFLRGLEDTDESALFLMTTTHWIAAEKIRLAELITAKEEYSVAVEAALGEAAGYFVVQHREDALNARNVLRNEGKGKAAFICRDLIPSLPSPPTLPSSDGIVGWASELVDTDEALRNALRGLWGRTVFVSSLDAAFSAVVHDTIDCAITPEGEIVYASGIMRGGALSVAEGKRVGKQKRIQLLEQNVAELQEHIRDTEQELARLKQERAAIQIHEMSDALRRSEATKARLEQDLHQLRYRRESLLQNLEQLKSRIQQLSGESAEALREDENIGKEIDELRTKKQEAQISLNAQLDTLRAAETEFSEKDSTLRQAEIAAVRTNAEIDSLESSIHRSIDQQRRSEERLEQSAMELDAAKTTLKELSQEMAVHEEAYKVKEEEYRAARSERMSIEARALNAREEIHAVHESLRQLRSLVEQSTGSLHQLELKASQFQTRAEEFKKRAQEELQIDLDQPLALGEEALSLEEARAQVMQLKSRLNTMGNVNFMALEEHDKEVERYTSLKTQYDDLISAEKNLQDTITEINSTAKQRFHDVFDKVRAHFKELFALLFNNDGDADLFLQGDDPLESHIEIVAKPKGKRPHSIEMLSGGEKTLTAIALLFAIYLVKPSPFCILDEVDAPLDDANIDRYLQLIRKFSENTQFLMITHNKKTMEAADTLYGVTMEEPGVSKMVSVQLNDGKESREDVTEENEEIAAEA